jgi:hypothetical protein
MSVVNLIVAVEQLDNFGETVEQMKEAGLRIEQQLKSIGVVTGKIDSEKLSSLRRVNGIKVENSFQHQIAPPESRLQ